MATASGWTSIRYALHPSMHMSTDMPTGITAMADSDTAVTVSWTAPTDVGGNTIAKYRVMWKMSSAADYADADMAMTADAMAMSHQVTGLTRGMDYIFKVVALDANDMAIGAYSMEAPAMNAVGNGEWSDGMATTHDVPGMPMNVMAAATSDTMITVTWEAPASDGGSATAVATSPVTWCRASMATASGWTSIRPTRVWR
jgi:titin